MRNIFKRKKDKLAAEVESNTLSWSYSANAALEQSLSQVPVPAMMKGRVKAELKKAAEEHARKMGHSEVTAEDLMNGLMSRLPAGMQNKVNEAIQKGPEGMKDLEDQLKKNG